MTDGADNLRPAEPGAVLKTLSVGLQVEGRRRVNRADTAMAHVTAERLAEP
jgi:hypothetical protein